MYCSDALGRWQKEGSAGWRRARWKGEWVEAARVYRVIFLPASCEGDKQSDRAVEREEREEKRTKGIRGYIIEERNMVKKIMKRNN